MSSVNNPNTNTNNKSYSTPSLYHLVTLGYCYRRIVYITLLVPLITIIVPTIFTLLALVLDSISSGLGIISIIISSIGTYTIFHTVSTITQQYTKKRDAYDKWIESYQYRVPILMLFVSCILCNYIIAPILQRVLLTSNTGTRYDNGPSGINYLSLSCFIPSLVFCFRLAVSMMILSLGIIFRYVGPTSIMRCSMVPLVTNPSRAKLRYYTKYPLSFLQPGDQPGELLSFGGTKTPNSSKPQQQHPVLNKNVNTPVQTPQSATVKNTNNADWNTTTNTTNILIQHQQQNVVDTSISNDKIRLPPELCGRRYQIPTFRITIIQLLIPMVLGAFLAYTVDDSDQIVPTQGGNTKSYIPIICIISTLSPSLLTILGNVSSMPHEIISKIYFYPFSYQFEWSRIVKNHFVRTIVTSLMFPWIASFIDCTFVLSLNHFRTTNKADVCSFTGSRKQNIYWIIGSFLISLYMYALDEFLKLYVIHCQRGGVKRLVDELQYDLSYNTTITVVMESLLVDKDVLNETLLRMNVQEPALQSSNTYRTELKYAEKLMQKLAHVLLSAPRLPSTDQQQLYPAPFEEDTFRLVFLESIGGSKDLLSVQDTIVSKRHDAEVTNWIEYPTNSSGQDIISGQKQHREISKQLIRTLSIFLGGYGEALSLCVSPVGTFGLRGGTGAGSGSFPSISTVYEWTLSSSSVLCLQFAIRGLTRCILKSLTPSSSTRKLLDWTNSVVATIIPTAITSLFYLRIGLANYAKYHQSTSSKNNTPFPITSNVAPDEIIRLVHLLDTSAISILQSIRSYGHSTALPNLDLKEDVLQWTRNLMAS